MVSKYQFSFQTVNYIPRIWWMAFVNNVFIVHKENLFSFNSS